MPGSVQYTGSDGRSRLDLYAYGAGRDGTVVREGGRYRFVYVGDGDIVSIQPSELFELDPEGGRAGSFEPRQHVGAIAVEIVEQAGRHVSFDVEVGPTKLEYETEYRAMMEQIADAAAEAVLQGFAPSTSQVHADPAKSGELRYRSLAFLIARLKDAEFQAALERIIRRPHERWEQRAEVRSVSRGLPTGREASRMLTRPGRRVPAPGHLPVPALPATVRHRQDEATFDTPANRFVRHAFSVWQGYALQMLRDLGTASRVGAGPRQRGRRESEWLVERCEAVLRSPAFRDVGPLVRFPHGDTVLLRQPGYREVLRVFALAEASMALSAVLPDDPFAATQRNVAALYEYWCYFVLMRAVSGACGTGPRSALFVASDEGLSLRLQQGKDSCVDWETEVAGRRLAITLWFNRTFPRHSDLDAEVATWTNALRPDVSVRIRPTTGRPDDAEDPALDVWVHFDAKYRVHRAEVELTEDPDIAAHRADILKMHAYRDAIRRSAGAYVLYPGAGRPLRQMEFHEVLPGIGAFPLRPGPAGEVGGIASLHEFVREVLSHTANQASSAERAQFWQERHVRRSGRHVRPSRFLRVPPADEGVLIGYVRGPQVAWVRERRRYNLRADGRPGTVTPADPMLAARLVLLWRRDEHRAPSFLGLFERTGPWQVASGADLMSTGYPRTEPDGGYLVAPMNPVEAQLVGFVRDIGTLGAALIHDDGSPATATWEDIARRW